MELSCFQNVTREFSLKNKQTLLEYFNNANYYNNNTKLFHISRYFKWKTRKCFINKHDLETVTYFTTKPTSSSNKKHPFTDENTKSNLKISISQF